MKRSEEDEGEEENGARVKRAKQAAAGEGSQYADSTQVAQACYDGLCDNGVTLSDPDLHMIG